MSATRFEPKLAALPLGHELSRETEREREIERERERERELFYGTSTAKNNRKLRENGARYGRKYQ